ncbi:hypothetical protein [Bacterioplanoides sp.]|uniref:hypothetical protein n=1 Tax=Bacterioplanoides sp. TaxID=2066072 RepID=UPI003B594F25
MALIQLQPFYRGDDHALQVLVKVKDSEEALDITGWEFTSTMKLSSELPDQPALDDQGNRQVLQVVKVADANDDSRAGRIDLLYPAAETRQLLPTSYEMDIQCQRNGITQTLVKATITVLADVSHGDSHD